MLMRPVLPLVSGPRSEACFAVTVGEWVTMRSSRRAARRTISSNRDVQRWRDGNAWSARPAGSAVSSGFGATWGKPFSNTDRRSGHNCRRSGQRREGRAARECRREGRGAREGGTRHVLGGGDVGQGCATRQAKPYSQSRIAGTRVSIQSHAGQFHLLI